MKKLSELICGTVWVKMLSDDRTAWFICLFRNCKSNFLSTNLFSVMCRDREEEATQLQRQCINFGQATLISLEHSVTRWQPEMEEWRQMLFKLLLKAKVLITFCNNSNSFHWILIYFKAFRSQLEARKRGESIWRFQTFWKSSIRTSMATQQTTAFPCSRHQSSMQQSLEQWVEICRTWQKCWLNECFRTHE